MKTRLGFVSNSSSSSFVLYGYEIGHDFSEDTWHKANKLGLKILSGGEDGVGDATVVGKIIGETDDGYMDSATLDMNELTNSLQGVKKLYENGEVELKTHDPKLYIGTRMC